ncbi:hypothetical protein BY996DRAFT_4600027 [Phakopsora pachyrhizi]|nr:hypothetical protein BY996DRAFT_4600027 [Phakopsora pachyrhizi]
MTPRDLIDGSSTLWNDGRVFLLLIGSALPIWLFDRFRWNNRIGIDQINLILLQVLSILTYNHFRSNKPNSQQSTLQARSRPDQSKLTHEPIDDERLRMTATTTTGQQDESDQLKTLINDSRNGTKIFPTKGLTIVKHRSFDSIYSVRVEFDEDEVSLEQLVRCITERRRWEWDRMCDCGEDLGDGVSWVRLKGFWPIKPKELVVQSQIVRLASSEPSIRILASSHSVSHPRKKATLEVKFAGYLIEKYPSSSTLGVTQIVDLSGFGGLPDFVVKAILTKFIPSSLNKFKVLAQGIEPSPAPSKGERPIWLPRLNSESSEKEQVQMNPKVKVSEDDDDQKPLVLEQLQRVLKDLKGHEKRLKQQRLNVETGAVTLRKSDSSSRRKFLGLIVFLVGILVGFKVNRIFRIRNKRIKMLERLYGNGNTEKLLRFLLL